MEMLFLLIQLGQIQSRTIAGASAQAPLWDIDRVVSQHGGKPADWVKKVSVTKIEGKQLRWIENIKTGQKIDIKFNE